MQTQLALADRSRSGDESGGAGRAAGLGWFSVGLGVAQLVAPRSMGRLIGAGDDTRTCSTMRALGLRELTSGLGILTGKQPGPWLWARLAGDLMDLALLGRSSTKRRSERSRLLGATAAVVGVAVLDGMAALGATKQTNGATEKEKRLHVNFALTINRPVEEVYRFWHDFGNFPRFMAHLESVQGGGRRSRWKAKGPLGLDVSWEAELVEDRLNESISWRAVEGSMVENSGVVTFRRAPGDRGTEIHVELQYEPPLGLAGFTLAKLFGGVPEQQIHNDLMRLKQILETGEVVHSDASIHRGMHAARPATEEEVKL